MGISNPDYGSFLHYSLGGFDGGGEGQF